MVRFIGLVIGSLFYIQEIILKRESFIFDRYSSNNKLINKINTTIRQNH